MLRTHKMYVEDRLFDTYEKIVNLKNYIDYLTDENGVSGYGTSASYPYAPYPPSAINDRNVDSALIAPVSELGIMIEGAYYPDIMGEISCPQKVYRPNNFVNKFVNKDNKLCFVSSPVVIQQDKEVEILGLYTIAQLSFYSVTSLLDTEVPYLNIIEARKKLLADYETMKINIDLSRGTVIPYDVPVIGQKREVKEQEQKLDYPNPFLKGAITGVPYGIPERSYSYRKIIKSDLSGYVRKKIKGFNSFSIRISLNMSELPDDISLNPLRSGFVVTHDDYYWLLFSVSAIIVYRDLKKGE